MCNVDGLDLELKGEEGEGDFGDLYKDDFLLTLKDYLSAVLNVEDAMQCGEMQEAKDVLVELRQSMMGYLNIKGSSGRG